MKKRAGIFLTFAFILFFCLSFIIAPNTEETNEISKVSSIKLIGEENIVKWNVEGQSSQGFKIVWSKNENPTYPLRKGDQYIYLSNPGDYKTELNAFDGSGVYYVRVCEYLGGKCGVYSNQIKVSLGAEGKIEKCTDTDGGIEYSIFGEVIIKVGEGSAIFLDFCETSSILNESYCEGDYPNTLLRDCGMEGKVCLKGKCIEEEDLELEEKEDKLEDKEKFCSEGCTINGKCVNVCYIYNNTYCSLSGEMVEQQQEKTFCYNHCECLSGVCVNNECISGNLIQKILSWFRKIF